MFMSQSDTCSSEHTVLLYQVIVQMLKIITKYVNWEGADWPNGSSGWIVRVTRWRRGLLCSGRSHLTGGDHWRLSLTGEHLAGVLFTEWVLTTADRRKHAVPELHKDKHTACLTLFNKQVFDTHPNRDLTSWIYFQIQPFCSLTFSIAFWCYSSRT